MDTKQLYQERLARYLTALRNEKPDKIPIRPFVAEFTGKYAGMTSQQVAHDYNFAFEAAVKASSGKMSQPPNSRLASGASGTKS